MPRKSAAGCGKKREYEGGEESLPPVKVAKAVADCKWRSSSIREKDILRLIAERLLQEKGVVQWRPAGTDSSSWEMAGNMWTAMKNKLKKLSPSSSWRSRGTASSRDNMSVDSSHRDTDSQEDATPAVPRSRVQGRIRVLTSVEQLVPRNDYEWEALDLLKTQMYHHVRIFEPLFFIKRGLKADMTRVFSHVGWYNFADMSEPGTCE
ncbi:hypothetical protein C2845_PM01G43130 [Panicum miliaceum]|uniref:Uncharacterized protein n=1 Tax=Panicum miliaceum TaxID=4540 RepID=A0A3L6TJU1_PANMI|nr:hypothetical protein C2845_PM01G43130 [Panicum miliaceum]